MKSKNITCVDQKTKYVKSLLKDITPDNKCLDIAIENKNVPIVRLLVENYNVVPTIDQIVRYAKYGRSGTGITLHRVIGLLESYQNSLANNSENDDDIVI